MLMRAALGLCLMMAGCEADVSKQRRTVSKARTTDYRRHWQPRWHLFSSWAK